MPSKLNAISTGTPSLKFTAAGDGALEIQNDGNTAITISNTGISTFANPFINDVPMFEAFLTSNQIATTTTFNKVNFIVSDNVGFDSHSWYDAANFRYTPQIAGYYLFTTAFTVTTTVNTSAKLIVLYKNGGLAKYLEFTRYGASSGTITASGSSILYMNGNTSETPDYVEVYAYPVGSGTLTIQATQSQTYFQGHLIKRTA